MTILDQAHAAMEAGGEAEALAFWRAFADAELFLVLECEVQGEVLEPKVFDLSMGQMLLAFDTEERLATISDRAMPYVALPGRVLAGQLAGQGLALGLNLGSGAGCETVVAAESLDWLAGMLAQEAPQERQAQIARMAQPLVPEPLVADLTALLPPGGLAALAQAEYEDGGWGHVLAFAGFDPQDEARMARAVTEVLAFSGLDAAALDLVFLPGDAPLFQRLLRAGLTLNGPAPAAETVIPAERKGPGMDPQRPPVLK